MRINEPRIRQIIREEARRVLREGEGEDSELRKLADRQFRPLISLIDDEDDLKKVRELYQAFLKDIEAHVEARVQKVKDEHEKRVENDATAMWAKRVGEKREMLVQSIAFQMVGVLTDLEDGMNERLKDWVSSWKEVEKEQPTRAQWAIGMQNGGTSITARMAVALANAKQKLDPEKLKADLRATFEKYR